MREIWRLKVRDDFSAAHALRNYHGKCERTHGHNFAVEVCVEGSNLDSDTGLLLDFGTLKRILKTALGELDHSFLNEKGFFIKKNPSSENIAKFIWRQMRSLLKTCADPQACKIRLKYVEVAENERQSATYSAEEAILDTKPSGAGWPAASAWRLRRRVKPRPRHGWQAAPQAGADRSGCSQNRG